MRYLSLQKVQIMHDMPKGKINEKNTSSACHTDLEQSEREVSKNIESIIESRFFANAQNDKGEITQNDDKKESQNDKKGITQNDKAHTCHTQALPPCHTEPLGEVSNPTCHTERSEVSHNAESKRDFSHSLKMTTAYKDSGIKWLGEIPQSWKNVSIRSCFTESNQRCNTDSYPLLSVTIANGIIYQDDIENKKDISNDDKSNYKIVPLNAVAYNKMRMWQGAVGVNTLTIGIVSPAYIVAIPNEKILPNFVSYLFKSKIMISEFDKNSYGLCLDMNNLRYDDFRNIKIPLPPLQEQKEIAEFLDKKCEKIQNYIDKKQKLITLLQEKKQALINEAVCGRVACHTADSHCHTERSEVSHNAESKRDFSPTAQNDKRETTQNDKAHTCHTERSEVSTTAYKPSDIEYLGLIPHHWEVRRVATLGNFFKGSNISKNDLQDSGVCVVLYGDIYTKYEIKTKQFQSKIAENFAKDKTQILCGDLLFSGSGETKEDIGKCICYLGNEKAYVGGDVIVLRQMGQDSLFLSYVLNSDYIKYQKAVISKGEIIIHIYASNLRDLKIPLPPLQEQKQIANFLDEKCEKINSAIEKTKRQIELIKEYKNTLINEAVCGRIRVN